MPKAVYRESHRNCPQRRFYPGASCAAGKHATTSPLQPVECHSVN